MYCPNCGYRPTEPIQDHDGHPPDYEQETTCPNCGMSIASDDWVPDEAFESQEYGTGFTCHYCGAEATYDPEQMNLICTACGQRSSVS